MCRTRWKTLRLTSHRCGLRFADWMLQDAAEMYCRQSKSAGKCPLVPPHATTKASTNQTQTYGRLWEPGRRTWNSQTMSEIHSHSLPSRECQSQTTSQHPDHPIPRRVRYSAIRCDTVRCTVQAKTAFSAALAARVDQSKVARNGTGKQRSLWLYCASLSYRSLSLSLPLSLYRGLAGWKKWKASIVWICLNLHEKLCNIVCGPDLSVHGFNGLARIQSQSQSVKLVCE